MKDQKQTFFRSQGLTKAEKQLCEFIKKEGSVGATQKAFQNSGMNIYTAQTLLRPLERQGILSGNRTHYKNGAHSVKYSLTPKGQALLADTQRHISQVPILDNQDLLNMASEQKQQAKKSTNNKKKKANIKQVKKQQTRPGQKQYEVLCFICGNTGNTSLQSIANEFYNGQDNNAGSKLAQMKKQGLVNNPTRGQWNITDQGVDKMLDYMEKIGH